MHGMGIGIRLHVRLSVSAHRDILGQTLLTIRQMTGTETVFTYWPLDDAVAS